MTNLMAASMFRACLIVLIVHLGFIFQGCAGLEYLDGSSKEETEKFKMTKNEMWNKIKKLKIENARSQKQIDISIQNISSLLIIFRIWYKTKTAIIFKS